MDYKNVSAIIINGGAHYNVAVFHPLTMMSPIRDGTQESAQLPKFQAVILALDALSNTAKNVLHLHIYKLLEHCLRVVLSRVNIFRNLFVSPIPNISKLHMLLCIIRPQYKASLDLPFRVLDITESN